MSHVDAFVIEPRTARGTTASRRMRIQGLVPVNVYGHNQEASLGTISSEVAGAVAKSGAKVVDFKVGSGAAEKGLVREIQWDTFGVDVLHLDIMRVDENQRVTTEIPLHLRGTAPGVMAGGVLEQPVHHVTLECLAVLVPDEIPVRVGALQIGDSIHVSDLTEIPPGARILTPGEIMVVHIVTPRTDEPAPAAEAAPAAGSAT